MAERTNDIRTLADRIKGIRIAMLTTEDEGGTLRSRPMYTLDVPFERELWFFIGATTPKAHGVQQHRKVNLSYAAPEKDLYISLSGTAEVVHDEQKARDLWQPDLQTWFPKGPDTPDLALLKVTIQQADCWASPDGTITRLSF